ncbi:hypothetical protein ABZ504_52200 [Streptomyces mirabilis]|uniref:hypothetical protein n=1 Tax=Streptomyces mirabilis TaxID=68239 RepID=UPI0033C80C6B
MLPAGPWPRSPAAAEALAASLLAPAFLHDTQILGAAVEAGIDTSAWEERREKTRTYTRDAYELPPQFDPATEAKRIWASLYDHYPQIATALIDFLQGLPTTWREDLFTSSPHSPAATRRTVLELPGPETALYDPLAWEDCPACAEAQDQCRYHRGVFAGVEYQRAHAAGAHQAALDGALLSATQDDDELATQDEHARPAFRVLYSGFDLHGVTGMRIVPSAVVVSGAERSAVPIRGVLELEVEGRQRAGTGRRPPVTTISSCNGVTVRAGPVTASRRWCARSWKCAAASSPR